MNEPIIEAIVQVFQWNVLLVIVIAAAYGLFMGAVPGLTATMAVALLIPFTFFLDNTSALAAIVTLAACAIFSGDIPATLLRIPGTPSSAAYVDDAYAMTQQGKPERALQVALLFSVTGGLFGTLVLMTAAPWLARIAFQFTTYEYFWLMVMGLSCAVVVSRGPLSKGLLALMAGLLLSTVGLSEVHGEPRFTFGRDELIAGVNFIPAMIGLFGMSELLRNAFRLGDPAWASEEKLKASERGFAGVPSDAEQLPVLRLLWKRKGHVLRSSSIGSLVGMLPGAGADIGAWISYGFSKRLSKRPEEYGRGSLEGIGDATSANNSSLAGAWIPALVFGIPGDSITAIVIGVLLMKNITPGPQIFNDPVQSVLLYSIFLTFLVANLILIPLGLVAIRAGSLLVRIPRSFLLPVILVFCVVGSYAIAGSYFDVGIMLAMGALGFAFERNRIPLGPVVLGIILGGRLEQTFIQNLTKSDSLADFFSRPASAVLAAACLLLWLTPFLLDRFSRTEKSGP
ncbi:MAG TPA: tripartite tricarboxylate transporter permease [Acidobacteriota bacterium]|nr:tripartite tricarboxylate transporter permease [Acidobacteriota bacterium]